MIGWIAAVVAVVAAARSVWSPCGLSMVSTITPVTERGRGHRYPVTAAWFVLGAVAGGAVLGAGAAVAAWAVAGIGLPVGWRCAIGAAGALVGVASDLRWFGFALPDHPRQVNETWLVRYRRWIYAAGFGAQIGCGFATYIMTAGVYLTVLLAALTAHPAAALAICVGFGSARGLAVLLSVGATSAAALGRMHAALARLAPWSIRTAAAGQAWAAVALTGAMFDAWWPAAAGLPLLVSASVAALPRSASRHQAELVALRVGEHDEPVVGVGGAGDHGGTGGPGPSRRILDL